MAGTEVDETKLLADAKKLPWPERTAHKNWKVRREAFEDISKTLSSVFDASDPRLQEFGGLLAKGASDTNVATLDTALEAIAVLLEKADEQQAERLAPHICATVVKQVLKQRPGTVGKATTAVLSLVELEQGETVAEAIVKGFSDKVPKAVVAALDILLQAVRAFGPKVVPFQHIAKALPALYDAKAAPARDGAKQLTVELGRWLGPDVLSAQLEKMPDAMRKEVEAAISEARAEKAKPERFTRKEAAKRAAKQHAAAASAAVAPSAGPGSATPPVAAAAATAMDDADDDGIDAYEMSEPFNLLGELGKAFWEGLAAAKWSERRDALQSFRAAARKPRLAGGDYGDVLRELRKILTKDSNVVVVAEAVACIGALAKGLRKEFGSHAKTFCPLLLDKFKDKNTNVCNVCAEALALFNKFCGTPADFAEDYILALAHKNPKVRLETLKVLQSMMQDSSKVSAAKVHVTLLPAVAKAANDPVADIREAALAVLVVFALKAGSLAPVDKVTDRILDDARKKKLSELVQEARQGGAPAAPAAAPAKASAPPAAAAGPRPLGPHNAAPARPTATTRPGPIKRTTSSAAQQAAGPADDDDAALSMGSLNANEAAERMTGLFGATVVAALQSANWKERLEAMEGIQAQVEAAGWAQAPGNAVTLYQGLSFMPGWAEKNFQVLGKTFAVIGQVAAECSSLTKQDVFVVLGGMVEKMADVKLKGPAGDALLSLAEVVGLKFICNQLHKKAAAHKNPKVLSETILWMSTAVEAFGLGTLDVKLLIDWMKVDLGSANAAVRNAAIKLLGGVHSQLGAALPDMLRSDVKPALMTVLDDTFKANPPQQVVPTRRVRSSKPPAAAKGPTPKAAGRAAAQEADLEEAAVFDPDELLPRADISASISAKLLAKLGSANWKERNAGLEEVELILKANGNRIQPAIGDLMTALKGRLTDSNRNLAARALMLLGELGRAMGPPIERAARNVLPPALLCLSDSKSQVRSAVMSMLDGWVSEKGKVPPERLMPALHEALAAPKAGAEGKVVLLRWMAASHGLGRAADTAAKSAVFASQDKSTEVREAGVALFKALAEACERGELARAVSGLPGSQKQAGLELFGKHAPKPAAPAPDASTSGNGGADAKAAARSSANSLSRQGSVSSVRDSVSELPTAAPAEVAPLLRVSEKKDDRARKAQARVKPGKFEGLREDEEEQLQQELSHLASEPFRSQLFGRDFRQHVEAAEALRLALPEVYPAVVGALDLLLRWLVLRICDANMQSLLKVLELTKAILDALLANGYQLTEYEAQVFLPALIEKSGHNQDWIRVLHVELVRQACYVYPVPRVVEALVGGLASKNNRTRCCSAEVIALLVQAEGTAVYHGSRLKPLPALAQLVGERDKATRAAALATLEAVYQQEGPAIWRALGRLPDQQRSLIEERFKAADKQAAKEGREPPGARCPQRRLTDMALDAAAPSPRFDQDSYGGAQPPYAPVQHQYDMQQGAYGAASPAYNSRAQLATAQSMPFHPATYAAPPYSSTDFSNGGLGGHQASPFAHHATPPHYAAAYPSAIATPVPMQTPAVNPFSAGAAEPAGSASDEQVMEVWVAAMVKLHSTSGEEVVEGMKALCYELMDVATGKASPRLCASFSASANELLGVLCHKVKQVFSAAFMEWAATQQAPSNRSCKYTVNLLMQTFGLQLMAGNIGAEVLRDFITSMLLILIDPRVKEIQDGAHLTKALNVLMLKVLENSNRTFVFCSLLLLAQESPAELHNKREAEDKFFDLVVKCLIKLTKALSAELEDIDLAAVLFGVHEFFQGLGIEEIRQRGAQDDKPLRMVKTLLHELCKRKGVEIVEYMGDIPSDTDPLPIVRAYVHLNLEALIQAHLIPGPLPASLAPALPSAASPSAAPPLPPAPASATPARAASTELGSSGQDGGMAEAHALQRATAPSVGQDLRGQMAAIFKQIGDKESTERGLEELHDFMERQPEVDVASHLARTSAQFQRYIRRGLQKVAARRTTTSGSADAAEAPEVVKTSTSGAIALIASSPNQFSSSTPAPDVNALRERMNRLAAQTDDISAGPAGKGLLGRSMEDLQLLQARMKGLRASEEGMA